MKHEQQMECRRLTQWILEEWWNKNPQPFIEAMDEDIMWIASGREEYYYGKEECLKHCARLEDLPSVYLQGQEYSVVFCDRNTCVVAGRYVAHTAEGESMVLSETQRITFVWKAWKDRLSIVHLHLSNALHILEEGEDFPRKAGLETAAYLERLLDDWAGKEKMVVMDTGRREYIIPMMDVLYVEADGEYSRIHTLQKIISCTTSFKEAAEQLSRDFFQIRRGIMVNIVHVRVVETGQVILFEGTKLPVARRRMTAFRERLREAYKPLNG